VARRITLKDFLPQAEQEIVVAQPSPVSRRRG